MPSSSVEVSRLLRAWGDGDQAALNQLTPLVYAELHQIAHRHMRQQHSGQTLQTTALVNEAYLRLVDVEGVRWQDRTHFFAVSHFLSAAGEQDQQAAVVLVSASRSATSSSPARNRIGVSFEQPGREIVETPAPGQPLVGRTRRLEIDVLDPGLG